MPPKKKSNSTTPIDTVKHKDKRVNIPTEKLLASMLGLVPSMQKKIMIAPDTKLSVQLTLRERDLIRDKTFCDPDFARLAEVKGGMIVVPMTLDDIEEVQGYVAAEANHTKDRKLEKELDGLFSKFQYYLDIYEEE